MRLCLFVSGGSAQSRRALENLRRVCDAELGGRYELEVVDVLEHPQRAEEARILATPTLVRLRPEPVRKLIGDFSDGRKLLAGLDVPQVGGEPRP